ncbi:hypothetical protein D3C84_982070 [compost metagenome]
MRSRWEPVSKSRTSASSRATRVASSTERTADSSLAITMLIRLVYSTRSRCTCGVKAAACIESKNTKPARLPPS